MPGAGSSPPAPSHRCAPGSAGRSPGGGCPARGPAPRGRRGAGAAPRREGGERGAMAGLGLIRQRPGSAKGVVFITIEDETGVANLVVWPDVFEKQRKIVMGARLMAVQGLIQRDEDGAGVHGGARRRGGGSQRLAA